MSEYDELTEDFDEAELTEPGGAKPEAGSVMPPGSRRDTDARLADLGARSLDVPGSVSSANDRDAIRGLPRPPIKTPADVPAALERVAKPDPKPQGKKSSPKTAPSGSTGRKTHSQDLDWLLRRSGGKK